VIIIIGVLVGVALPQFRKTFDNLELENFTKDIYYLTGYLRESAISQGKVYCLNFASERKEFQVTYRKEGAFEALKGKFGKIYIVPQGVTIFIDSPEGAQETKSIYFYPDGSIDKATIIFENRYGRRISLIIPGAGGEIKVQ